MCKQVLTFWWRNETIATNKTALSLESNDDEECRFNTILGIEQTIFQYVMTTENQHMQHDEIDQEWRNELCSW
jgi:hypothetical protein